VNEHIDLKDAFSSWKTNSKFSFCHFPFLLDPVTKNDLLRIETMCMMRHELQEAFFRAIFEGTIFPYLLLFVRRDYVVEDTIYQLATKEEGDYRKQLRVQFIGEEGVDEGGLQKEFFQLIIRNLFKPDYGMFCFDEVSRCCWFQPQPPSLDRPDDESLVEYRLLGVLIGLAIYNGVALDLHFPLALYKKLMDSPVVFSDLASLNPVRSS
jgi:hypothetical protein